MTYALVDNATLTAVQRIIGKVEAKSRDSVDTDIIALENLIQAILLYDEVVVVDDYKPQYRDERISEFPFIKFLNTEEYKLATIEDSARSQADQIRPEIRGGEFANEDFKRLIELLQTHITCTWDVSSSVYYLTLKGLAAPYSEEFEKYGKLAASIFSELGDASKSGVHVRGDVALVDRYGNPIDNGYTIPNAKWGAGETGGVKGSISAFVASLVWLSNRSIFYSMTGKYLQADTFLYPIRQTYQQYYISKMCGYGENFSKKIVESFSSALSSDLVAINEAGLMNTTAIDLPIFSAWLAKETGDVANVISAACDVRNNAEFVEAREQLKIVRSSFDNDDIASANRKTQKVINELSKVSSKIRIKYGIETQQGSPVTRLVHVYNTYAALNSLPPLPNYDFDIQLPSFLRDLNKPSGFSSIYRNISNDLTRIWALGDARTILGARVKLEEDAISYSPKSEDPRYRNSHSGFKSPM